MLSVRQNVFTCLVVAQAINRAAGLPLDAPVNEVTEVVAEQRAVAVIWRDPYPVDGGHEQIVAFIQWLPE